MKLHYDDPSFQEWSDLEKIDGLEKDVVYLRKWKETQEMVSEFDRLSLIPVFESLFSGSYVVEVDDDNYVRLRCSGVEFYVGLSFLRGGVRVDRLRFINGFSDWDFEFVSFSDPEFLVSVRGLLILILRGFPVRKFAGEELLKLVLVMLRERFPGLPVRRSFCSVYVGDLVVVWFYNDKVEVYKPFPCDYHCRGLFYPGDPEFLVVWLRRLGSICD